MSQAHYHPDLAMLTAFFAGQLPMGFNLAVSAHVDTCPACQQQASAQETAVVDDWFESSPPPDIDLTGLMDAIVTQPATAVQDSTPADKSPVLTALHDYQVSLPRILASLANEALTWKELGSGIFQALLPVDATTKCEFISLQPGSRVPRHTHLGQEIMLVLHGDIEDDWDSYGAADFVHYTPEHCHGQVTRHGCVCLFVTDAPLRFTEGLPRLMNPINRIKHWWQSHKQ